MTLQERLERLEPRERQLLLLFVGVFVLLIVVLVPLGLRNMAQVARERNTKVREAIRRIEGNRGRIKERQARIEAIVARYASPAPDLASYLSKLAKSSKMEIPESKPLPEKPHGKLFEERMTEITLRRVGMLILVNLMESIARSKHPVVISRLNIRKRATQPDSYDVELVLSAFDRKAREKKSDDDADEEEEG